METPVCNEEWKPIKDTGYEISSFGNVRRGDRELKGWAETNGYRRVEIRGKKEYIHQLVCDAFNPSDYPLGVKTCVHHKNRNKTDNRAANL